MPGHVPCLNFFSFFTKDLGKRVLIYHNSTGKNNGIPDAPLSHWHSASTGSRLAVLTRAGGKRTLQSPKMPVDA